MRDYIFSEDKMTKRAVFLDRDGTINLDVGYAHKKSDLHLFEDFIEALKIIESLNVYIFIVTNQSGIALGKYDAPIMSEFNKSIISTCKDNNITIHGVYYCPHYDDKNFPEGYLKCDCSKPNPGLLIEASNDFSIDFKDSIIVGDQPSDIGAGISVGIENTILVTTGIYKHNDYRNATNFEKYKSRYIVSSLLNAANIISRIVNGKNGKSP